MGTLFFHEPAVQTGWRAEPAPLGVGCSPDRVFGIHSSPKVHLAFPARHNKLVFNSARSFLPHAARVHNQKAHSKSGGKMTVAMADSGQM